ncbi:unnamed protein product [Hermetia illucens]|uniref:Mutator-like transposase domain-containing protein n=1 Tax=Hermetia illucens TaxID=343691 RepID=A0A7R8UXZ9_HERIL|nr:unnamed protein product [Hermetia illucens]
MDRKGKKRGTKSPGDPGIKRKFHGNRYTAEKDVTCVSKSAEKLKNEEDIEVAIDESSTYALLSFTLVFSALESVLICKACKSDIKFLKKSQVGLGFNLCIKCKCNEFTTINSCPKVRNAFEVNRHLTFVMRLLGVGLSGINIFCAMMDLGPGLSKSGYYSILDTIHIAVKSVAKVLFRKAAQEEKKANEQEGNIADEVTVSGDGSWAKRGFTSLLGIVSLIGKYSNKVIDVMVKSKVCKACEKWVGKENKDEYLEWYEDHQTECTANHEGSSGKMEVDGVIEMFRRSVEELGVKYKKYIGDGDSKTYKNLLEANIYNNDPKVEKNECVLHVKRRMYRRVKEAKKTLTQLQKAKKKIEAAEEKSKKTKKNYKEEKEVTAKKGVTPKKGTTPKKKKNTKEGYH